MNHDKIQAIIYHNIKFDFSDPNMIIVDLPLELNRLKIIKTNQGWYTEIEHIVETEIEWKNPDINFVKKANYDM